MKRKFSDLHCHNHMRAHFHMQEKEKKFERKGEFSPWTVIASNSKKQKLGKMGASYSQIDLVKCWNGNVRLTFNSLYPLERQFVVGMNPDITEDKWYHFFARGILGHSGLRRDLLQTAYMRIPDKVIDFFQSEEYDYWDSLNEEKNFVLLDSGKRIIKNEIHVPSPVFGDEKKAARRAKKDPDSYVAENACYRIPKNKAELIKSLADDTEITMILTIEGAHAIGTDRSKNSTPTSIQDISDRIKTIKGEWEVPVFFITVSHHFDNHLCGHAHSIPGLGKVLMKQHEHMNTSFRPNGHRIVRELLGLNSQGDRDPALGYRILIDVKHMAARSRQEYYTLVNECLAKGDRIPVIASHCGYSGIESLDEHIKCEGKEVDDYLGEKGKNFNAWNINMCDQDIEMIVKTRGMFGISFDQRILGITKKTRKSPRNGIKVIWENIEGIVLSAYENPNLTEVQKTQIWKSLTIGTDFEGLIDPVNAYPTALEYSKFADHLVEEIDKARLNPAAKHLAHLMSREDVEKLVDDFCYHNAEAFVIEHYPV